MEHQKVILVTGAAGFIGSHFCDRISSKYPNYRILALDKMSYCSSIRNLEEIHGRGSLDIDIIVQDLTQSDKLILKLLREKRVNYVIHLAASSHVDRSFGDSLEFTKNNVLGTHMLLEACREYGQIERFLHVSTDEVYGESSAVDHRTGDDIVTCHALDEESIFAPTNPYAATKAAAECLVKAYFKSFKLPAIITRSNNVFGPRQFPEKIIPKFICRTIKSLPCCIHGDGSEARNYLYVEDVVSALDAILHKGRIGDVYNIGGNSGEISNLEVAKAILSHFGITTESEMTSSNVEFVPDRPFNDRRYRIDSRKLSEELGWTPIVSFSQGMTKTIDWYRSNDWKTWWPDANPDTMLDAHPQHLASQDL